jgi:hypothetical protein
MSHTVFLSTVTREFGPLRQRLAATLRRTQRLHLRHQDDFVERGVITLRMLLEEIAASSVVVHVVGAEPGAVPPVAQVEELLQQPKLQGFAERFPEVVRLARAEQVTYTQWEAWLALHFDKRLCLYRRDGQSQSEGAIASPGAALQADHADRLQAHERYCKVAADDEALYDEILLTLIELRVLSHDEARRPLALPYPPLGTLFKGRDEFLAQLRTSLQAADRQASAIVGKAVHGLGGVGKTRLAVEYAWQHKDRYSAVLFVVADSPENLHRNLAELVGPLVLNLPEQSATEESARVAAAVRWLQDHPGWFLILDNVDSEQAAAAVENLLPHLPRGHVVITSRLARWSDHVTPLELDVLPRESAAQFLLERTAPKTGGRGRRLQETDDADANRLAQELVGLALAMEQAGAYIVRNRITLADYLQRWHVRGQDVQQWHDQREMKYPRSVAVTWQTTLDQLSPTAAAILDVVAWLAPEPIPMHVFDAGDADDAKTLEGWPPADVRRDALAELVDFSMVRWDVEQDTVSVHRVVQEILRSRQQEPARALTLALRLLDLALPDEHPGDVRCWPLWEPLRPHVALAAAAGDRLAAAGPTSRLMNQLAQFLLANALLAEAEPLMLRALAIDEAAYGPNHPELASRLNNLAQLFQATNRLREAEPLMRRALAISEAAYGPNYLDVGLALSNLAYLLQATNRSSEAEPLMRRALDIFEKVRGADHPDVATAANNLAQLLAEANRLSEAEPLMRRALAIDEAAYGPDHPKTAVSLGNLAKLFRTTNRLGDAEPMMRRVVDIFEKSYGADHPHLATAVSNLAQLLAEANRLREAEPLMRRALAIDEAIYGPNHPKVAQDLNHLALLFKATNRLGEAEPLLRRASAIAEAAYGPDHPNVAAAFNNLALYLQAINRLDEAESLMRRVMTIREKSHGPDHPELATAINNLAEMLASTRRLNEAEPLMRRVVEIDEAAYGPNHPKVAIGLSNLAQLLVDTGRLGEAEPLVRRTLAIGEATYGPNHPSVAIRLNRLAQVCQATGRLREAEPLSRRHVQIFESCGAATGHEHPHMNAARANYASLLQALGCNRDQIMDRLVKLNAGEPLDDLPP